MSTSEQRRTTMKQAWERAWDHGDVAALDELLDPSYQRYGHDDRPQDLEGFKATVIATRSAFPDLVTTVDDILLEGDRAAVRWHSVGTHEHSFLDVPATGRRVSVSGATFSRYDGDRIVEEHVTWDPRALLTALGVISVGQD